MRAGVHTTRGARGVGRRAWSMICGRAWGMCERRASERGPRGVARQLARELARVMRSIHGSILRAELRAGGGDRG